MPDAIVHSFADRHTYIAHGEAFAPLLALYHESEALRGHSVSWFLDNLGVLSAFCTGSSTVADFGCLIHACLLRFAALQIAAWFEHVDSAANAADGGTRGSSLVAEQLGIALKPCSLPPWPRDVMQASASEWLALMQRAWH